MTAETVIDAEVLQRLKRQMTQDREKIEAIFAPAKANAAAYFRKAFAGCRTVAVADTGWKGSSVLLLQAFLQSEGIPVRLVNVLLGTSASPAVQCQIEAETLYSYLFSTCESCARLQRHMRCTGSVCSLTEMLCTTDQPPLQSYAKADDGGFTYGKTDAQAAQFAHQHWAGVHDFAADYHQALSRLERGVTVTAEDAYAPFDALTMDETTLLTVFGDFHFGLSPALSDAQETVGALFARKGLVSAKAYRRHRNGKA